MQTPTDEVHRLAMRGLTDAEAPARARGSIDVEATPEEVFDVLADVANWPSFRGDVTDASAEGPAAPGQVFTWRANGVLVTSRFALVERPTRLTWSNGAPGMSASCVYLLSPTGDGSTQIRCEESMDASVAAPHIDDEVLGAGIASWLTGIRAFVESGVARPGAPDGRDESADQAACDTSLDTSRSLR